MFVGAETVILSIVLKALEAFLVVDRKHIESELLSKKGNLKLPNVQIKERKFRLRKGPTFLCLAGSIKELALVWDHDAYGSAYDLTLRGFRLSLSFYEEERTGSDEHNDLKILHHVENLCKEEEKKEEENHYFSSLLKQELQTIRKAVTKNLKESKFVTETLRDALDAIAIRLVEPRISIKVPGDTLSTGYAQRRAAASTYVSVGADRIDFVPEAKENEQLLLRRPIMIRLTVKKLFINLIDETKTPLPIVESFTYTIIARRFAGLRFVNMASGYQIIGREHSHTTDDDANSKGKYGLVVHVTADRIQAIKIIVNQFRLKPWQRQQRQQRQRAADAAAAKPTEPTESARVLLLPMLFTMLFMAFLATISFSLHWNTTSTIPGKTYNLLNAGVATMAGGLVAALFMFKYLVEQSDSMTRKLNAAIRASAETLAGARPIRTATFRFPFPYASIVLKSGMNITLSQASFLGRMDGMKVMVCAQQLDTSTPETPRLAKASGIQLSINKEHGIVVNLDEINELLIPHRVQSAQPILGTIVRLKGGVLNVELSEVRAQVLQGKKKSKKTPEKAESKDRGHRRTNTSPDVEVPSNSTFAAAAHKTKGHRREHRRMFSTPKPQVDETTARIRRVIRAEIRKGIEELRAIAVAFEEIELEQHWHQLRRFQNAFRGSQAVDFLVKCNFASSRKQAVHIGRMLQSDFNLFGHVTGDSKFKDDFDCIYQFTEETQRRNWREMSLLESQTFDSWEEKRLIPFPIVVTVKKFTMINWQDGKVALEADDGEIFITPGSKSRVLELTFYVDHLRASMLETWNMRVCLMIHPDLQREIHKFQLGMDTARASPGHSLDDWYDYLKPYHAPEDWWETIGVMTKDMADKWENMEKAGTPKPTYFPHAYISPFKLQLRWNGIVFSPKMPSMMIEAFQGSGDTSSNDLIQHLVLKVLGRTPGALVRVPRAVGARLEREATAVVKVASEAAGRSQFGKFVGSTAQGVLESVAQGTEDVGAYRVKAVGYEEKRTFDFSDIGQYITDSITRAKDGDSGKKAHPLLRSREGA